MGLDVGGIRAGRFEEAVSAALAKFSQSIGEPTDPPKSTLALLDWLPPFVVAVGIAGWVSDAVPATAGIALIVVGSVGSTLASKMTKSKA